MRSIKTLLTIMLHNIEEVKKEECGLCYLTYCLLCEELDLISYDEYKLLETYISNNKPWHARVFMKTYWYAPGRVTPRKRWLKKHIKKN